jgi:hypothetical protein
VALQRRSERSRAAPVGTGEDVVECFRIEDPEDLRLVQGALRRRGELTSIFVALKARRP